MAGGPSTPELVAAVAGAGGFGYLGGGYKTVEQLRDQIAATRTLTDRTFGVNLFVPATPAPDGARDGEVIDAFRRRLQPLADSVSAQLPQPRWEDTDSFAAKIDLLVGEAVGSVSFTFGCPGADVIRRLYEAGTDVTITVTDPDEALAAVRQGADTLCVQGAHAGGHRSTHRVDAIPNDSGYAALLREVRSVTALPLVAAGGIGDAVEVRRALELGAVAAQVGTAFLLTDEAGTSAAHRAGLVDAALTGTVVTRAFSGRPARGLRNRFVDTLDDDAPSVFPIVDQLTKPVRAAAAAVGDHQLVSLWAGTGWRAAQAVPAAQVVRNLTP